MKRTIFMAALVLSLTACDNTKLQLRAPEAESSNTAATDVTAKSDSSTTNSIKKDSVISH
jgi:hypothetical protein